MKKIIMFLLLLNSYAFNLSSMDHEGPEELGEMHEGSGGETELQKVVAASGISRVGSDLRVIERDRARHERGRRSNYSRTLREIQERQSRNFKLLGCGVIVLGMLFALNLIPTYLMISKISDDTDQLLYEQESLRTHVIEKADRILDKLDSIDDLYDPSYPLVYHDSVHNDLHWNRGLIQQQKYILSLIWNLLTNNTLY